MRENGRNSSNAPILNERVKGDTFRLVGVEDAKGEFKMEIVNRKKLFDLAESLDLDVFLVNFKTDPPCVKILNWSKQEYKRKKGEIANRKQNKTSTKEIRISPSIHQHDIEHKRKQAEKFLNQGHKVKVSMRLKGRFNSPTLKAKAELTMLEFIKSLELIGSPETLPTFISGKFLVMIKPNKK